MDIVLDIAEEILKKLSGSSVLPRPVRIIMNVLYILLLLGVSVLVLVVGIYAFRFSVLLGIFCTALGMFMLVRTIRISLHKIKNMLV